MPGALEALDEVLAGVDGGGTTAAEAIERLLAAQITLRNSRRLATAMRSSRLPAIKTLADFDFSFQPSVKTLTNTRHTALLVVDEIGYLPVTRSGAILFFQLVNRRYEHASTLVTSNKGFEQWGEILHDEVMAAALLDRLLPRRLRGARRERGSRVMMGVRTPSGAPAPVATLPPRRLPKSVLFSMARSVHFLVAIDIGWAPGEMEPAPGNSPGGDRQRCRSRGLLAGERRTGSRLFYGSARS